MNVSLIGIVLILSMIIGPIYCLFMYFKSKVSLITIQYAGGEIGFDKRWFTSQEIELFQRQLRLAKDKVIEDSENSVANRMEKVIVSMSSQSKGHSELNKLDELAKLGDLLKKGVITQNEFEKMKKEIM